MTQLDRLSRFSRAAVEFSNVLLTANDASIGVSPRQVVWTHRKATLYRYTSDNRSGGIPVLLVFALINRPSIFDLVPGNSLVEFLLEQGHDVFMLDWGVPGDEDAEMGIADYVCDQLPWAIRETLRASGHADLSVIGWCMGGTFVAMHCALEPDGPVRNTVLLTTPIEPTGSLYARWVNDEEFDVDHIVQSLPVIPGGAVDWINKMMKPVTNYVTTYRQLWERVLAGEDVRRRYQPMAKWIADNPPFAGRAWAEWVTWMYKEKRLADGRVELRGRRVDLRNIKQSLLVVTAGSDHISPPEGTTPLFDLVSSNDLTHLERPGGHIGLIAGSRAKDTIWPGIADWLTERSRP